MKFHKSPATFPGREFADQAAAALSSYPAHIVHGVALFKGELIAFGSGCDHRDVAALIDAIGADADAHICERDEYRVYDAVEPVPARRQPRGERVGGVTVGSRTAKALKLHQGGMSVDAAADEVGINPSALYRAKKRAAERWKTCVACGRAF